MRKSSASFVKSQNRSATLSGSRSNTKGNRTGSPLCCMMYHQLTREQRYAIYLGLQEKDTLTAIARRIGVNKSTVSREITRNKNRFGKYGWRMADEKAAERRERLPGNRSLSGSVVHAAMRLLVTEDWSPRQISGYLERTGVKISHETIYARIRSDEAGELRKHCRHGMKYRHHVRVRRKTRVRNIPGRISIHERPPEADGRRFGDWEMDLIVGKGQKSAILTLCERSVNYMMMCRLPNGKDPDGVADAVIDLLRPYRKNVLTITTDNGSEFVKHSRISNGLSTTVYFADSYASWQKGAIENMNKLVRQYLPKGTDFRDVADEYVKNVQYKLNRRPREKLDFSTPKDEFFKNLL